MTTIKELEKEIKDLQKKLNHISKYGIGIAFSPDGKKCYTKEEGSTVIKEYILDTPGEIATAHDTGNTLDIG